MEDGQLIFTKRGMKEVATEDLSKFACEHDEPIATVIATDRKNIGDCKVAEILIKASMKVGDYAFQEAEIEVGKVNPFYKIYLALLKALKKIDYKDVFYKETICGLAVIITFRIIISR